MRRKMICKSCSAEYDDNILVCPYCGTENKKAAQELKEDILENYDREAEQIKRSAEQYPEKAARKWTKYMVYVVAAIVILGIVFGIIAIVVGKVSVSVGHEREQKHLTKLEELYQAKDYVAVDEYLSDKDLWGSSYEKYDEIAGVSSYYSYMENDMMYIEDVLAGEMSDEEKVSLVSRWCESVLKDAASVLRLSKEYSEDMQFLGNEEELDIFYADVVMQLEQIGYSEEEIEQIAQIEKDHIPEELLAKLLSYYLE